MAPTPQTSYRLSDEAKELLAKIAEHNGVSRTAALELIIREHARSKGLAGKKGKA